MFIYFLFKHIRLLFACRYSMPHKGIVFLLVHILFMLFLFYINCNNHQTCSTVDHPHKIPQNRIVWTVASYKSYIGSYICMLKGNHPITSNASVTNSLLSNFLLFLHFVYRNTNQPTTTNQ